MLNSIERVLVSEEKIKEIVKYLGERINNDYHGKNLMILVILKGGFIFASDLLREINIPVEIDFMAVSSYGSGTETSGEVKIIKDLSQPITGKDVLIIEDILDSGVTLSNLIKILKARNPESVEICTILNKPDRRKVEVDVKYSGIDIPDEYVVGYGLDYDEKFRNLPFVGVLKREVYEN